MTSSIFLPTEFTIDNHDKAFIFWNCFSLLCLGELDRHIWMSEIKVLILGFMVYYISYINTFPSSLFCAYPATFCWLDNIKLLMLFSYLSFCHDLSKFLQRIIKHFLMSIYHLEASKMLHILKN